MSWLPLHEPQLHTQGPAMGSDLLVANPSPSEFWVSVLVLSPGVTAGTCHWPLGHAQQVFAQ